jgi:hypothetical protein
LRTRVTPSDLSVLRSAASCWLPRYKKGRTREAGCESMSGVTTQSLGLGHERSGRPLGGSSVSSQNSL